MFGWFKFVKKILKLVQAEIDVVHACDLDSGLPAKSMCKKYNKKLVYDIYDYYIDAHRMFGRLSGIVEKMEIKVINFADCTIILHWLILSNRILNTIISIVVLLVVID